MLTSDITRCNGCKWSPVSRDLRCTALPKERRAYGSPNTNGPKVTLRLMRRPGRLPHRYPLAPVVRPIFISPCGFSKISTIFCPSSQATPATSVHMRVIGHHNKLAWGPKSVECGVLLNLTSYQVKVAGFTKVNLLSAGDLRPTVSTHGTSLDYLSHSIHVPLCIELFAFG